MAKFERITHSDYFNFIEDKHFRHLYWCFKLSKEKTKIRLTLRESVEVIDEDNDVVIYHYPSHEIQTLVERIADGWNIEIGEVAQSPNILAYLRSLTPQPYNLKYVELKKQIILIPASMSAAALTILAFHNKEQDPLVNIKKYEGCYLTGQNAGSILMTYYLSCVSYIFQFDICSNMDWKHIIPIASPTDIIETRKGELENKISEGRDVQTALIYFHTIFFCYCLCRNCPPDSKFKEWARRRYNAIAAATHTSPDSNITLDVREGGLLISEISAERPELRRIVLFLMKRKNCLDNGVTGILSQHIEMLTMYSHMSTLNFIHQLIATGGALIALAPVVEELKRFAEERKIILAKLKAQNFDDTMIPYYKIINPEDQCFLTSKYSNIIQVVCAIDKHINGKNYTMGGFKGNLGRSTLSQKALIAFIQNCPTHHGIGKICSEKEMKSIANNLGIQDIAAIASEAKTAINNLARMRGIDQGYVTEESEESQSESDKEEEEKEEEEEEKTKKSKKKKKSKK